MRWIYAATALILWAAAGCGKEKEPGAAPTGPGARSAANRADERTGEAEILSAMQLDEVKPGSRPYKIALVIKTRNNPFFIPMIEAFETEAKQLGAVPEVQAPPQESDVELQFSLIQNLTARKPDAILVAPADSKAVVPALVQAEQKGILVINVDNRVDSDAEAAAGLELGGYVGADNERGGELAGTAMVRALNGAGNVAILEGIRGADNAEARKRGFEKAVKDRLEIVASESAEWDTQKAYAKFQSILASRKDLNGVFCANDKMALGAIKAISEAGMKGKIKVIGYDNIPDVRPYLESGEMEATIEQHPDLMGKYAARMAVGILEGALPKGREHLVALEVIRAGRDRSTSGP